MPEVCQDYRLNLGGATPGEDRSGHLEADAEDALNRPGILEGLVQLPFRSSSCDTTQTTSVLPPSAGPTLSRPPINPTRKAMTRSCPRDVVCATDHTDSDLVRTLALQGLDDAGLEARTVFREDDQ